MAVAVLYTRSDRFADGSCYRHHGSEISLKRGRQKTVTWPINEKLCEVCYFLVDDAPSSLGKQRSLLLAHNMPGHNESRNLIGEYPSEAKRTRFMHVPKPPGNLAPGFGLSMPKSSHVLEAKVESSMMGAVPWQSPGKFILDEAWLWAGGEESIEVALQQQRELRQFEAFYPRLASIPDSPAEPVESPIDNSLFLNVPLIPLEEEEARDVEVENMIEIDNREIVAPECTAISASPKLGTAVSRHDEDVVCNKVDGDCVKEPNQANLMNEADSSIAAVAAAACMIVKSLGESDLVDEKLLLQLLKNPSLLKSLTCSNQIIKNKSQAKTSEISQEPIASLLGKLSSDHGAYTNASPVSVLARWEEGAFPESPSGTPSSANGDASFHQPVIEISNVATTSPPIASLLSSHASHKPNFRGRDFPQQGFAMATRAVSEVCRNGTPKPSNVQESSMLHVDSPKDDGRLSCQDVLRNNLGSAACSMQSAPLPSSSVRTSTLSNNERTWRAPPRRDSPPPRRLAHDPDSKTLQAKMAGFCAPPNMGGGGRAKRFCMYFNSPRGCRNGSSCAFLHQTLDSELHTTAL